MRIVAALLLCATVVTLGACSPRQARQGGPAPVRVEIRLAAAEPRPGFQPMDLEGAGGKVYVSPEVALSNADIVAAQAVHDELGGNAVEIRFSQEGQRKFTELTTAHVGDKAAIIVDGRVNSAPTIRDPVTGGRAMIFGDFDAAGARELAESIVRGK